MPRLTHGHLSKRARLPTYFRQWREDRGLTQDDAAELIGIDRTYLSKLERQKIAYNQGTLEAAARAYGCSPADIISREPEGALSAEQAWAMLDDEDRQEALEYMEWLRSRQRTPRRSSGDKVEAA